MRTLIVLEDERKVQPFMITELKTAINIFDEVIIVTKELNSPLATTILDNKVLHIIVPDELRKSNKTKVLPRLFSSSVVSQLLRALFSGKLTTDFLRVLMLYLVDSKSFEDIVTPLIESRKKSDIILLSCWFYCDALAVSHLKKKYPSIKAVSLAHSFEIDPLKNNYVDYTFNSIKHQYLDCVYFISNKMREIYHVATSNKYRDFPSKVTYLGCEKKEKGLNPVNQEELVFHICTCSNLVPIKNVQLLLDSLYYWKSGNVSWTHFGGGPLYDDLKIKAYDLETNNPLIKVSLPGVVSNEFVHKYFATKQVDLFINVSKSEGVPVSLMEAIAYGIPIMATNVGGSSEIVEDSFGVLIDPLIKPDKLCYQIEKFRDNYIIRKSSMRDKAHTFWAKRFDASKNMKAFYLDVINL